MESTPSPKQEPQTAHQNFTKLGLEMAPLGVFFVSLRLWGMLPATAVLMVASVISLAAVWFIYKKVSVMSLITYGFVMVFGGLTLYFGDSTFIKIKLTIINVMFAAGLAISLYLKKPVIKHLLGEALHLQDEGCRILTVRLIFVFLGIAFLNEIVWRNFDDHTWGWFKFIGAPGISFLFMISQVPVLMKYQATPPEPQKSPEAN